MKRTLSFLLVLLCMRPAFAQDLEQIIKNKPNRLVNDFASVLSGNEQQQLENKLDSFDHKTSTQIAIVVINELKGLKLEETATRLFNAWGIGQRDKNNGLLVMAVINERKVRIEVGRGLESTITKEVAARIIQDDLVPAFKEAKYFDGFDKATNSLINLAVMAFPDTAKAAVIPGISETDNQGTPTAYDITSSYARDPQGQSHFNVGAIFTTVFILLVIAVVVFAMIGYVKRSRVKSNPAYNNSYTASAQPLEASNSGWFGGLLAGWFISSSIDRDHQNDLSSDDWNNNTSGSSSVYSGNSFDGGNSYSSGSFDSGSSFDGGSSSGSGSSGDW